MATQFTIYANSITIFTLYVKDLSTSDSYGQISYDVNKFIFQIKYTVNKLTKENIIGLNNYVKDFPIVPVGNTNSEFNNKDKINTIVMPYYCCQYTTLTKTKKDPITLNPIEGSSVIMSDELIGPVCLTWYLNSTDSKNPEYIAAVDKGIKDYCNIYNTYDCKCINRIQDPIYKESATFMQTNANCWYLPCTDSYKDKYLITSTISKAYCPTVVCPVNINISAKNYSKVEIDNFKIYNFCGNSINKDVKDKVAEIEDTLYIGIFMIVFAIFIIYYYYRKNNNK